MRSILLCIVDDEFKGSWNCMVKLLFSEMVWFSKRVSENYYIMIRFFLNYIVRINFELTSDKLFWASKVLILIFVWEYFGNTSEEMELGICSWTVVIDEISPEKEIK